MWLLIGLIVGLLFGHHIGCLRVGAQMKQVAYLKEYEMTETRYPFLGEKNAFCAGMRYLITEVTHDEFYYNGEQPDV